MQVDIKPTMPEAMGWIKVNNDLAIVVTEYLYKPDQRVIAYTCLNWWDGDKEIINGPYEIKVKYKRKKGEPQDIPYIKLGDEIVELKKKSS